jgi:hypothetical protein
MGGVITRYLKTESGRWEGYGLDEHIASKPDLNWTADEYEFFRQNIDDDMFLGTPLEYADFVKASQQYNPLKYARCFVAFKGIEHLHKHGLTTLVRYKLDNDTYNAKGAINWKARRGKDLFEFPHWVLKLFKPDAWNAGKVDRATLLWSGDAPFDSLTDGERIKLLEIGLDTDALRCAMHIISTYKITVAKLLKYLALQKIARIGDYKDYLNECQELKFDMSLKRIKFPSDFRFAHQETARLVVERRNAASEEVFLEEAGKYKDMEWESEGLMIVVPRSAAEIKNDGAKLKHCAGTYIDKIISKKTFIFFIRHKNSPEEPFYTLEYKNEKIAQCRGMQNIGYENNADVWAFVKTWKRRIQKLRRK